MTLQEIKSWLSTESDPSVKRYAGAAVEMVERLTYLLATHEPHGHNVTNEQHVKLRDDNAALRARCEAARAEAFEECAELVEDAYAPCDATESFQLKIAAAIRERGKV